MVIARVRSTLRLFPCLLATVIVAVSLLPAPLAQAAAKAPESHGQSGSGAGAAEQRRAEREASEREASRRRTAAASEEPGSLSALPVIFVGAALLLLAIAAYIVRDARRHAPVVEGVIDGASKAIRAAQARKRRAKAKEARQQRKRNR